jgi:lipopolysaccharide transport system ATP-binding protein
MEGYAPDGETMTVVQVENLSVVYSSPRFAGTLLSQPDPRQKDSCWLLEPLSFSLESGKGVGIIGQNGSGKSTVLKALAGIIPAFSGSFTTPEKTLSVLDLNLFFHEDFSGYENLFMMNACFGKTDRQLLECMDKILDYSEFVHRPVREYSTGMKMRLGVSYILFQEFDVLIIDEVLSVGDLAFQKKCISRLRNLMEHGKSIILSSHNLDEVAALCSELIFLKNGRVAMQGPTEEVVAAYYQEIEEKSSYQTTLVEPRGDLAVLDGHMQIKWVRFLNHEGVPSKHFHSGQPMEIEITLEVDSDVIRDPLVRIEFFRNDNLFVSGMNNYRQNVRFDLLRGEATIVYKIDSLNLLASIYFVSVSLWPNEYTSLVTGECYDFHEKRYQISVYSTRFEGAGLCRIPGSFAIKS